MSTLTQPDTALVTVTYLEMLAPPEHTPVPAPGDGITITRAVKPTVSFYRYLYDTVGEPWRWYDRRRLSDEDLRTAIQDDRVGIYVLYVMGTPAGYVELDERTFPDVRILYFGLIPEFIGQSLGTYLLDWSIQKAWNSRPSRVWVDTCSLDSDRALPLYQSMGFKPYKTEVKPPPARPK